LRALAEKVVTQLPQGQGDLQDVAQQQGGRAAAAVGGVLRTTWGVVIQLVMMLIAFFFFLVDGPQLVDWFEDVMPLGRGQTRRLLGEFRRVSVAGDRLFRWPRPPSRPPSPSSATSSRACRTRSSSRS
jgi:predicted PurR-regulated permease PerM